MMANSPPQAHQQPQLTQLQCQPPQPPPQPHPQPPPQQLQQEPQQLQQEPQQQAQPHVAQPHVPRKLPEPEPPGAAKVLPKKKSKPILKKAPGAPRRFKSAYMYFSTEKHPEIRREMAKKNVAVSTPTVAKMVSAAWKSLSEDEKKKYHKIAEQDKARYNFEMSRYTGPLKVPRSQRIQKDPAAPRKPMSSFLSFAQSKRAILRKTYPGVPTTQLSSIISRMWKNAPEEEKRQFLEKDSELRGIHKAKMTAFKEARAAEIKKRETVATALAAKAGMCDAPDGAEDLTEKDFNDVNLEQNDLERKEEEEAREKQTRLSTTETPQPPHIAVPGVFNSGAAYQGASGKLQKHYNAHPGAFETPQPPSSAAPGAFDSGAASWGASRILHQREWQLAAGWVALRDPVSGMEYYLNRNIGTTTWHMPQLIQQQIQQQQQQIQQEQQIQIQQEQQIQIQQEQQIQMQQQIEHQQHQQQQQHHHPTNKSAQQQHLAANQATVKRDKSQHSSRPLNQSNGATLAGETANTSKSSRAEGRRETVQHGNPVLRRSVSAGLGHSERPSATSTDDAFECNRNEMAAAITNVLGEDSGGDNVIQPCKNAKPRRPTSRHIADQAYECALSLLHASQELEKSVSDLQDRLDHPGGSQDAGFANAEGGCIPAQFLEKNGDGNRLLMSWQLVESLRSQITRIRQLGSGSLTDGAVDRTRKTIERLDNAAVAVIRQDCQDRDHTELEREAETLCEQLRNAQRCCQR